MFAPALVGVMPLSVAGFETCRSQLSSPGESAVEGGRSHCFVAKSEEVPWRWSVTNRDIRGPIGRPSEPSLTSASINLDRRRAGLGVSVSGYRSKGRREAAHTARCITSMGVVHDASKDVASYQRPARQRGSADRKPAQGMPEFNR